MKSILKETKKVIIIIGDESRVDNMEEYILIIKYFIYIYLL